MRRAELLRVEEGERDVHQGVEAVFGQIVEQSQLARGRAVEQVPAHTHTHTQKQ